MQRLQVLRQVGQLLRVQELADHVRGLNHADGLLVPMPHVHAPAALHHRVAEVALLIEIVAIATSEGVPETGQFMDLHDTAVVQVVVVRERQRHGEQLLLVQRVQLRLQVQLVQAEHGMFRRGHKDVAPFRVHRCDGLALLIATRHVIAQRSPQHGALVLDEVRLHVVDGDALDVLVCVADEDTVLEALHELLLARHAVAPALLAVTVAVQPGVAAHDQFVLVGDAAAAGLGTHGVAQRCECDDATRSQRDGENACVGGGDAV